MAHEIHKHLKSCVDAQKYETKEQQGEDVQGASQELFENLKSLKKKANNLSKTLTIVADEVMTVSDLYVSVIQSRIILKWFMYNPDKNTYYTEDNGDIEYHVKILAICVDKKNKFEKVTICDDIFTFNDVNRLTKESTDDMPQAKVETLQESTSLGATSEKKQISFHKPKKCIQLVTRFKCSTLKRLVCVNVCIQAKVSIQVKMLSPDKIVEDTIKGGTDPFGTAWMGRTKKQIENSGRLLDVTISGKMMSKQHIPKISLDSTSFHEFTTDHKLSDKQLEVTCILTPVSGAEMYLVQLIDTTDLTVIIEQGLVKQTRSSQIQIKHDIVAKYGMFPETSSGPYCVSILPLTRGEVALSPFVESSLKIVRYNSPELLSVELPNLDQSETDVKLNWKHPELTFNGDHLFDLTILAYAVKSRKIQNQSTETEEEKLKHPDIKRKEPLFKGKNLLFKHPVKDLPKSNTIDVQYQFNLSDLLAKYNPRHQNGILFCCKIFAKSKPKGVIFKEISQLQSMPKYFPDFILLAPPTNMKVVTRKRNAGLHISWDYGTHAIGYRLEMVVTKSRKKEFLKEFKCTIGGRGQAVLYRSDFKNIPCTSVDSSYELRMYSLGLGEDLIRCLKPSVVKNPDKMHVVPAQLGYIQGEKVIRITFGFTNQSVVKAAATAIAALITSETTQTYTVELYQTLNVMDKPSFLLTKNVRKSSDGEIVIDFPLDTIHSKLQSGSMISAWVYSWTNAKKAIYVGVPQEEVLVLKSPTLKTSFTYHIDGSIHQMKVLWSGIPGAIVYEYGFCLRDKIIKKTTDATQVLIDFTLTEYRRELVQSLLESNSDWQQCQLYVTALGQPKQLLIGALTMDVHTLNCLIIPSSKRFIVFNTSMLQNIWTWFYTNPINLTLVHCISKQKRYLIYPSKDPYPNDPFPSSQIPKRLRDKFWNETSLLVGDQHDFLYCRDIILPAVKSKSTLKLERVDPFEPFGAKYMTNPHLRCFGISELQLLFYTRYIGKSGYGITKPGKIKIEFKIEIKPRKSTKQTGLPQEEDSASLKDGQSPQSDESSIPEKPEEGRVKKMAGKFTEKILSAGSKVVSYLKGEQVQELVTTEMKIGVPCTTGPKRYCRLIKYTPKNDGLQLNSSSQLLVSLSIKATGCHIHTEDAHLFVRFSGFSYSTEKPYSFSVKRWENSDLIYYI